MQTSVTSERRMSNVYVEPDMQTSKLGDDVTTTADDTAKVHLDMLRSLLAAA